MKIRCVITDDEPMARKGLQGYVDKIDFLELIGVCSSAIELNNLLKSNEVDLVFLDIEMPYLSGIELLQNLPQPPKVIFTTAYEQYALKGYDLNIVDYLLKPISFERFLKAVNKAHDLFLNAKAPAVDFIFVKSNNKLEKVFFQDILYLEALENYVIIQTSTSKIITHTTLKHLLENLPPSNFLQTHKSFVVNIDKIKTIEGNTLGIQQFTVPVSRNLRELVMEKILKNRFLKK
ncbi:LytR/AlgR family response regulator transcription factor [Adhaeribacter radiodurans]|uniref:Response regulator transcription factor n=1 Tax=Adhaeribacter radiodurans TaxID=2745197 RepID=A0A7L7LDV4_9BACT|nr:LytTR family DNA-binding domain-containing protein [Adhaeribacter radiodurans]QMU30874.1 response regulator transcription factor [Adhaeribacter radiodurans]